MSQHSRGKQTHSRSAKPMSATHSVNESREIDAMRQNEVLYKLKIRSLELELSTLKHRLDSLRKAKNTTIVRKEVARISISSPKLGRRYSSLNSTSSTSSLQEPISMQSVCNHGDLLTQLEELRKQVRGIDKELLAERASHEKQQESLVTKHKEEVNKELLAQRASHQEQRESLIMKHEEEMNTLRESLQAELQKMTISTKQQHENKECEQCSEVLSQCKIVRKESDQLRETLGQLVTMNQRLRDSNLLLQAKCEGLLEDLSIKEARWTEREEALKNEMQKQWGQRYHEWLVKAEKKMHELQQVNTLLQGMLQTKAHNPDL